MNIMRHSCATLTVVLTLLCSCVTERSADIRDERAADDYYAQLKSATRYIWDLKQRNGLPEAAEFEHGNLQIDTDHVIDAQGHFASLAYPVSFTAFLSSTNSTTEYQYRVKRDHKHGDWRLESAWKKERDQDWKLVK
jgi:hypothetical protein